MDDRLLALLRCRTCGASLAAERGRIVCGGGHDQRVDRTGYVDLWPGTDDDDVRRTVESFGFEWTTFDSIEPEDAGYWRWYFEDVPLDELRGAIALDAGCGKGRYTHFTADHVAGVIALDASLAVEAAARNLSGHDNTVVVRGDLLDPPVQAGSFDLVTCLGVLHHLPDPAAGFESLATLLAPGGRVLVYLYSRPQGRGVRGSALALATAARRVTVRMPHPLLRVLSAPISAVLYAMFVLPGVAGERFALPPLRRLPLHVYRRKPWRSLWLDTFDRLSAPIEHRFTWDEVAPWFEAARLEVEAVREDAGLFILARRPPTT